jgi:opacity protein-like surface antigen
MKLALPPAAIAVALGCGSPALAEGFDGPFVQAGIGVAHARSDIDFTGWFRDKVSDSGFNGSLSAGYALDLGQLNIAVSVSHVLAGQDGGTTVQNSPFEPGERNDTVAVRLHDVWTANLEPGVQVASGGLVYAKLSYSRANAHWTFSRPVYGDSFTGRMRFHGFGLGGGYKHKLGSRLYAFAEAQHTWYGKRDVPVTVTTDGRTSTYIDRFGAASTLATLGLGARF